MATTVGVTRTLPSAALLLALWVGVAGPVAAATPDPSPSPTTAAPSPSAGSADGGFRADLLTAGPDPLTLAPVLATGRATSKVIGPKGGTLKARGTDGTRYTLDVPAGAVPMGITVTMTPIDDLAGLPEGVDPEHVLGVQLDPSGLPLAAPATLTIQPRQRLPVEVAAFDYEGSGAEAGLRVFDADDRRITMSIVHFSGDVVTFPTLADQMRAIAAFRRTDPARVFESEIARILAEGRQAQLMGEASAFDLHTLAREALPTFVELVLTPRLAVAGAGCAQAEAAIAAILAYEANRQLLGVGDDAAFTLPTGTSELMRLPARLVDLRVRLCFREAHAQCVRTGDFPGMAAYFFASFRQAEGSMGIPPTAEHIDLAHGYLRRCGQYRATVVFDSPDQDAADFERKERFRLEIELGWQPGTGSYGIVGSTIEGEGDHADIDFAFASAGCERRRGTNVSNARTGTPGRARIASLTYDLLGTAAAGRPVPPQPRSLELQVSLGTIDHDYRCTRKRETQDYQFALQVFGLLDPPATQELGSAALAIKAGWTFSSGPMKAEWRFRDAFPLREGGLALELDVTLVHEPG